MIVGPTEIDNHVVVSVVIPGRVNQGAVRASKSFEIGSANVY